MNPNRIKKVIRVLPKVLFLVIVAATPFLTFQKAFAQRKRPELKIVEYRTIDRIDGISGIVDLEVVLSLSNVASENVTVFGQNFNGKFSPIGTSYSVDTDQRKVVYADETKTILKLNGRAYTATRTIRPSYTLHFSIFLYRGNSSCLNGLIAQVLVRIGQDKRIKRITSEPLMPCST